MRCFVFLILCFAIDFVAATCLSNDWWKSSMKTRLFARSCRQNSYALQGLNRIHRRNEQAQIKRKTFKSHESQKQTQSQAGAQSERDDLSQGSPLHRGQYRAQDQVQPQHQCARQAQQSHARHRPDKGIHPKIVIGARGPAKLTRVDRWDMTKSFDIESGKYKRVVSNSNPAVVVGSIHGKGPNPVGAEHLSPPLKATVEGERVSATVAPPPGGSGRIRVETPEKTTQVEVTGGSMRTMSGEAPSREGGAKAVVTSTRSQISDLPGMVKGTAAKFPIPVDYSF